MEDELKYDHALENNSIKRSITPDNINNHINIRNY